MSYIDDLITELKYSQMSYDVSHEQGCADANDKARITAASDAIRERIVKLDAAVLAAWEFLNSYHTQIERREVIEKLRAALVPEVMG